MAISNWIFFALFAIFNYETVVSRDLCRRFPFPQSSNTYSICQKFNGGIKNQVQNVVLNCADASISELGKIEIGYRDRQCQGVIDYIGCCYGSQILTNSTIVCQSKIDRTGTTTRLLEIRTHLLNQCRGQSSCTYQLSLEPLLEQVFTDSYYVYLNIDYGCSSDSMTPSTRNTGTSPDEKSNSVLVIGWIVAAIIFILFIITIIALVFLYRQRRDIQTVQRCVPKSTLQQPPSKPVGPLPSVPYNVRNSSYSALDDRHYNTIPNDYEKLQMEHSAVHEYLEPSAPSEYSIATGVTSH